MFIPPVIAIHDVIAQTPMSLQLPCCSHSKTHLQSASMHHDLCRAGRYATRCVLCIVLPLREAEGCGVIVLPHA